jgi:Tn3 transposase DDE domain-containing protein
MLALHLIQNCMVYINTLMIQKVLAQPEWQGRMTPRDYAALTPLPTPPSFVQRCLGPIKWPKESLIGETVMEDLYIHELRDLCPRPCTVEGLKALSATCFGSFFLYPPLELMAHMRNQGSNPSNRLLDVGVKSASGRLLNSSYPSRGAFSGQAPKAYKNKSIGDLKLNGMRHFTHGDYRS